MNRTGDSKAFLVVLSVALVCSLLVSASVVLLRPIQLNNTLLERSNTLLQLSGTLPDHVLQDGERLQLFRQLDARVADLDNPGFANDLDPYTFDQRRAAASPETSTLISADKDLASLGRRSRHATIYMVWNQGEFERIILPVRGNGMWSMIYGFIALESDLNTIADAVFNEQAETPGIGDQITRPDWIAQWRGRQLFDSSGKPAFGIGPGRIDAGSAAARHKVDALTGATVTADAVTDLVHFWSGEQGYGPFLEWLSENPPKKPAAADAGEES